MTAVSDVYFNVKMNFDEDIILTFQIRNFSLKLYMLPYASLG